MVRFVKFGGKGAVKSLIMYIPLEPLGPAYRARILIGVYF